MDNIELQILNSKNKYITIEYIENTLKKYNINYKVKNLSYFQMALIHSSYLKKSINIIKNRQKYNLNEVYTEEISCETTIIDANVIPLQTTSYERMEFLGDSVIHLILAEYLYTRYPDQCEGFMTRLRTKIENGDSLAYLSKVLNLHEYVLISSILETSNYREKNIKILEDVFESFIAALYLDSGLEITKKFIISLIEKEIDMAQLLYNETNYKDSLMQYYHKMRWTEPIYSLVELTGPEHKKNFKMCVKHYKLGIIGTGTGSCKKKGEQIAAKNALIYHGEINDIDSESDEEIVISDSE
jgi:dsRNA-specific ribonuclease